jgi:hypothetical protein
MNNSKVDKRVVYAILILRYLSEHPDAKDTLEGIAKWWVLQETIDHKLEDVAQSIAFLKSKGFITEGVGEKDRHWYQLNKEKLQEINRFIDSCEGKGNARPQS